MKKPEFIVREYVGKLSDENLRFMQTRLQNRLAGGVAAAVDYLSAVPEVDKWLSTAKSGDEFFEMVGLVTDHVERETKRRYSKRG
jgi:hypothetical protein